MLTNRTRRVTDIHDTRGQAAGRGLNDELSTDLNHRLNFKMTLSRKLSWHQTDTRKSKGFTLLELVIVIAIIGILLLVAYPSYTYYAASARAARLNTYATAMMSGARMSNGIHIASGLSSADLVAVSDGLATNGWPKASHSCNVVMQQMDSGPDAVLSSTSSPIACNNGVLTDVTANTPASCSATYHEAGTSTSAYVDITSISTQNCK